MMDAHRDKAVGIKMSLDSIGVAEAEKTGTLIEEQYAASSHSCDIISALDRTLNAKERNKDMAVDMLTKVKEVN